MFERARLYLDKVPGAISGQGGDKLTYHIAALLVGKFGLNDSDALALMLEWNDKCQPMWSEAELRHKIQCAASAKRIDGSTARDDRSWDYQTSYRVRTTMCRSSIPKPSFCPMVLKRIARNVSLPRDVITYLKEQSPIAVDPLDSAAYLSKLYPRGNGEKVLVFSCMRSQGQLLWEADQGEVITNADIPAGSDGVWFLPQPVDGQYHDKPLELGAKSRRSKESVTSWRYLVLESDEADSDDWLRCVIQLPLRIVSICDSGGRSIHALVRLDATSKENWDLQVGAIKNSLITLGADSGALSAVRLTRLPQARRGERIQQLYYFNPSADGTPIERQQSRGEREP